MNSESHFDSRERRRGACVALLVFSGFLVQAHGQIALVPAPQPQQVFGEGRRQISVTWSNTSDSNMTADLRTRLVQASSATAVVLGDWHWKELTILAGQTILESASLPLPGVRGETRCLVQWMQGSNVLGTTDLMIYPTNLLQELHAIANGGPVGVFDPQDQLKPLLKGLAVDFTDLEDVGVADFTGKLAILSPSQAQWTSALREHIKTAAHRGVRVVLLQPPPTRDEPLRPSFYVSRRGKGLIVFAETYLVTNLAENPQSQLNLLALARLAVAANGTSALPLFYDSSTRVLPPALFGRNEQQGRGARVTFRMTPRLFLSPTRSDSDLIA